MKARQAIATALFVGLVACAPDGLVAKSFQGSLPTTRGVERQIAFHEAAPKLRAAAKVAAEAKGTPTLCRGVDGSARALIALADDLRYLPGSPPKNDARPVLSMAPLDQLPLRMKDAVKGAVALAELDAHRYVAVVRLDEHVAPERSGDRTVSEGHMTGHFVLVDWQEGRALCRGEVKVESSRSMNAYDELSATTFKRDLRDNFQRELADRLRLGGGPTISLEPRVAKR